MSDGIYDDYDAFARIYDRHWAFFAGAIRPVLDRLALGTLPDGAHVVDLCCGTGVLAASLCDRFQVTGVDGSAAMIDYARTNAPDATFVVADAREFGVAQPAAAVVSTFDSLNHVMTIEELTGVFQHVRDALMPRGAFVFDLNMEDGYEKRWHDGPSIADERDVVVGRSRWDPETGIATIDFVLVERADDGELRRADLTLTQRCYTEDEILGALREAGFNEIGMFDGATDLEFAGVGRAFFVAR
ncbi:MAG: methyltransferase domain-containing protein [Actinomycetota bacterium]